MNEGVHAMQTLRCFGKSLIFSTGFTKKNQIIMNSLFCPKHFLSGLYISMLAYTPFSALFHLVIFLDYKFSESF